MEAIQKLAAIINKKDKSFMLILVVMSIFLSIIETVGITAIMPFISVASNPNLIHENPYYYKVYQFFCLDDTVTFVVLFGSILIGFYLFRAVYSMYYSYLINKFAFGKYHNFSFALLEKYLKMPYELFVNKNSATLTKTIITEASHVTAYVHSLLLLFSELITISLLYFILLLVNFKMTVILTLILGLKVFFLMKTISKKIKKQGVKRSDLHDSVYKIISQTLNNIKFIKLKCNDQKICAEFDTVSRGYADVNILSNTLQALPRNILETLGFSVLIGIVLYVLIKTNDAAFVIPIISMYALALYRMLPALNRILTSYNQMLFYGKSLEIVYDDLAYIFDSEGDIEIEFHKTIELKNVCFRYGERSIFNNYNMLIEKGEKVAFIGASGSGKSTLVDIISGIYKTNSGKVLIDGVELNKENIRSWKKKIGYIPQNIYLFDGTVSENVAFGDDINKERIIEVLKLANIYDFLVGSSDGINTKVGDGGVKLSGGQKQRIGIARALYNDPKVLILDEATSALDNETESKIMEEIYQICKEKTLLIIAHRLSTVEKCDRVIQIGKIP